VKVAIAGAGNVGFSVATDLCRSGHDVLLIETDLDLVERLRPSLPCGWYVGDACEVSTLHDAGVGEAEVVVAATGDDEDNLVVSLLAKQEMAVPRVIARVNHPKNLWLFNETWGVDVAVSTPHLMTALVDEAVSVGTLVRLFTFAEGSAHLVEATLAEDTPASGKAIADLGVPRDASVVAVVRDRRVVVPRGDTVVEAGDEVIALVTKESEPEVRRILVGEQAGTGGTSLSD
jgi:trk system potassium uptake protein